MDKPIAKVHLGENIFALLEEAEQALTNAGHPELAVEMKERVIRCGSYREAFTIILDYVKAES